MPARARVSSGVSVGLLIRKVAPALSPRCSSRIHSGHGFAASRDYQDRRHCGSRAGGRPNRLARFCGCCRPSVESTSPTWYFGQPIAVETQMQVNYQLRPRNRRTALYALFRLSLGDGGGDPNQRATDYEMHFSRGRQKAVAH